jgi:hypothetical protein
MLFLPFLNHPCIGASIVLQHALPRAACLHVSQESMVEVCTVTPSTLTPPALQPAQPQGQASRCSPGYLGRPNYRRRSAKLYLLQQRGPLVWEEADVCCPRSGLLTIRGRGLPHIRVSRWPGRQRLAPGAASMAVQQQLSWHW